MTDQHNTQAAKPISVERVDALRLADELKDMTCLWSPSDNRDRVERAAAELRRLAAQPTPEPSFAGIAARKLADLQSQGYMVDGYSIQHAETGQRGLITTGGFVGWWNNMDHVQPTPEPVALQGRDERWKVGNEFAPFHKSASHISPDYRDGWNACYEASRASLPAGFTPEQVAELVVARDKILADSLPAGGVVELGGLGFMCCASGESDVPVFAFARTPEEVGLFLCREWFGEPYAELSDDDKACHDDILRQVRADKFDPDAWDGTDHIGIEFEIGGIEITRCALEPLATPHPSETQGRRQDIAEDNAYKRGFRDGYNRRDDEVKGALL